MPMGQRTRREIRELGKDFFRFVDGNHSGWRLTWTKAELKQCFVEEYKPWLQDESNRNPGYSFSTMLYGLQVQGRLRTSENGSVVYKKKSGHVTVDQHSHFKKQPESRVRVYPTICEHCAVKLNSEKSEREHLLGKRHKLNLSIIFLRQNVAALTQDKHGVSVTSGQGLEIDQGRIVFPCERGTVASTTLVISTSEATVQMELVLLLTVDRRVSLSDELGILADRGTFSFAPGQDYEITVQCNADNFGDTKAPIAFAFKIPSKRVFHIFRNIIFEVGGKDKRDLQPTGPYLEPSKVALKPRSKNVLFGKPPEFSGCEKLRAKVKMGNYFIPEEVARVLNEFEIEDIEELTVPLSAQSYSEKFRFLLFAEEHQMKYDIQRYDRRGVKMTKSTDRPGLLKLKVPGLAENRPSVLRGDHLLVSRQDDTRDRTYRGYVHHIEQEEVSLHFHDSLLEDFIEDMKFDVKFTFSRFPLRLQQFAIDRENLKMDCFEKVLFPEQKPQVDVEVPILRLFDRKLEANSEQVQAIGHILLGSSLPAPYLLFGPPGTGKTVTIVEAIKQEQVQAIGHILPGSSPPAPYLLFGPPGTGKTVTTVEAIKQVYHQKRSSVILACAPSNSASDLITRRLLESGPVAKSTLLRMSSQSRSWESVDPILKELRKECLNYDDHHDVYFPSAEEIKSKRIVVVTMVTAGRLVLAGEFEDHFTHIFLDEAGYAVEPEALIPVSGLLPTNGQLVLAGDPQQLGPVLRSPISVSHGLGKSLLERLMKEEVAYRRQDGRFNARMVTKLLRNYRSHPSILKVPNEMFYQGELQVFADEIVRNSLTRVEFLPKKGFPMIFHGIEGKDEREEKSPSFFNVPEAEQAMKYVKELMELKGHKTIREADIGVISPYRKQVQKIQKQLKKKNLQKIKVGSVEEFQGQERLVIIISTVRSTREDFLQMDKDYKLGFLQNPKRFNVAITRAKALLICIGNPHMLNKDQHWRRFLDYCYENGAYTGCPYTPRTSEEVVEELCSKVDALKVVPPEVLEGAEMRPDNDPQWRGEGNV